MAVDDRVKFLISQEIDRVMSEAAAGPDDLHTELHQLATKVASLSQRVTDLEAKESSSAPFTPAAASRGRTPRKAVGE